MREKGKGWQEEAGGSELESWQAGRQASSGPGVLDRETTVKNATNLEGSRDKLEA